MAARAPLRVVYDDGKKHSEGTVRGMWSSGIVLETDVHPSIGTPIALVVLSGGFDGDKLSAQVAGVERNALLLDLPGLDPVRWARLQALVDGKPMTATMPTMPAKPPPPNAPTFIISGGEEEGTPTGVFELTEDMAKKAAPGPAFAVPSPLDPFPFSPPPTGGVDLASENAQLRAENVKLRSDLKTALAKLEAIERSLKR